MFSCLYASTCNEHDTAKWNALSNLIEWLKWVKESLHEEEEEEEEEEGQREDSQICHLHDSEELIRRAKGVPETMNTLTIGGTCIAACDIAFSMRITLSSSSEAVRG